MTAPYTFVDFRDPVPGAAFGDPDGAVFDVPVPGRRSGRIDLTVTTLSPLFIGSTEPGTGMPVMLGGKPVIPGSSLKGMVRAYLAAMFGSSLGPQEETFIWYRNPVSAGRSPTVQALTALYQKARGVAAQPGGQRIGILRRDPDHGHVVVECPQLRLPTPRGAFYSMVPKVTWTVLERDLRIRRTLDQSIGLNDRPIFVVWAALDTSATVRGTTYPLSTRKVVFAVGTDAQQAATCASARRRRGEERHALHSGCHDTSFVSFLDEDGLYKYEADPDEPVPVEMILHATGLTEPEEQITAEERNAYLFPIPGTATARWIGESGDGPATGARLPAAGDAVAGLTDEQQVTDYQQGLPAVAELLAGDGVPVFFDVDETGTSVVRLGRANGFRIKARHPFTETIPEPFRQAGFDAAAPNLVQSLLGDADDEHSRKGRLSFGTATAENFTLLSRREVTLLGPKIGAWYRRLQQPAHPETGAPSTYDSENSRYRGRQMYLHRWHLTTEDRPGKDEHTWQGNVKEHNTLGPANARPNPLTQRPVTPVAPRTLFTGSIRFTNLTDAELGAVLWALTLGNDAAGNHGANHNPFYAHQVGGLRPLGFGSVHLAPTLYLHHRDRYTVWDALWTKATGEDLGVFLTAFRTALRTADPDYTTWIDGPDGRRWPRSVAEVFTIAQWRTRLSRAETAEMRIEDHQQRRIPAPLSELFPDR